MIGASSEIKDLTIIISGYNEGVRVKDVLENVLGVIEKYKIGASVLFLDNHSTDDTGTEADSVAQNNRRLQVIHRRNRPNKDLGSSILEGISLVQTKHFMIMDCDLSHNPEDIPKLFERRFDADIVIGSRFVNGGSADLQLKRSILSQGFNTFARIIVGIPVYDLTTGFKLYKTDLIKNLTFKNNGFGLHVEMPIRAFLNGATVLEIPIHYSKSPKKSTLRYRKQFFSYMSPVICGGTTRIRRWFNL